MASSTPPTNPVEGLEKSMRDYQKYLQDNYEGGCDRFFSPTGFLNKFQRTVEVKSQSVRNHVFVKTVDEAQQKLEPAIAGQQGVFDLTAEPGTGKTSVLPFRFPSKKVIVALPTPFDAFNAFNMATGDCQLRLKGLRLGNQEARVVYTDSYMASYALLSDYMEYDIMIVDECDSDRGVSKFLSEVKTKGKLLIRMSASHGKKQAGLSRAFAVTEARDMPDPRDGIDKLASYVRERAKGRALVLAPDATVARELSELLPGSQLVSTETRLDLLARLMTNQKGDALFVSDDTCGRAINLNLDMMFDCQLVTEFASMRVLTKSELYQRMGRVGRNRTGWYFSPGLETREKTTSDYDTVRHNIVRAFAKVEQAGAQELRVSEREAEDLMDCPREPFEKRALVRYQENALLSSSSSNRSSMVGYITPESKRSMSPVNYAPTEDDEAKEEVRKVKSPPWAAYYTGCNTKASDYVKGKKTDTYIVTRSGTKAFERRTSSGSSGASSDRSIASALASPFRGTSIMGSQVSPNLPVAKSAPYAVDRRREKHHVKAMDLPMAPPVMDLTMLEYDMDWPSLIRDRLSRGGDLPTLVPPGSWRHTSSGGLGSDWFRRLEEMSVRDHAFDDNEFEVVCRAWNKLVAQAWVRKTPGLSNVSDMHRMEFCVRYFQSYFLMGSVG